MLGTGCVQEFQPIPLYLLSLDSVPVFFLHTLIVPISQGRMDQGMDFHLQNESPYRRDPSRREKVADSGPAQKRKNKHHMQKAVTFAVLPTVGTS